MHLISFITGVAVGAGLEYLLDPDAGEKHRERLGGRLSGLGASVGALGTSLGHQVREAGSGAYRGATRGAHAAGDYAHNLRERFAQDDDDDNESGVGTGTFLAAALGALGLGAVLMYAMDPNTGNLRRKLTRDQLRGRWNDLRDQASRTARYVGGHMRGYAHEARSAIRTEPATDDQIRERIRAELGHVTDQMGLITVEVRDGNVTLRGSVADAEADRVLAAARGVNGVQSVESQLQRT